MAITKVQSKAVHSIGSFVPYNATITWDSPTTTGNLLVAFLSGYSGGFPTLPSGWSSAVSADSAGAYPGMIAYRANAPSESTTGTFAFPGDGSVIAVEYSGMETSSPVDVTSSNPGSGTSMTTGQTTTTSVADSVCFAGFTLSSGTTPSATGGYTQIESTQDAMAFQSFAMGKIVSATGTQEGTATQSSGSSYVGAITVFKGVSAPATQNLTLTGVSSLESFGTSVFAPGAVNVSPTGVSSLEAFGTAALTVPDIITPTGIASGESFGTLTLLREYIEPPIETITPGLYKPCPDKFKKRSEAFIPYSVTKRMFHERRATYNARKKCMEIGDN